MTDLFGLEQQTPRTNNRPEAAALLEVLKALHTHPLVSWCERMNSGAVRVGGRLKIIKTRKLATADIRPLHPVCGAYGRKVA